MIVRTPRGNPDGDEPASRAGMVNPDPHRTRIVFLIESPSGIVHMTHGPPERVRAEALCGRRPESHWTRSWEQEVHLPVNLIGVCSACSSRLGSRP